MIADLLPRYYEVHAGYYAVTFTILRSMLVDGHETAWMELSGKNVYRQTWTDRWVYCECDFTEGVGWKAMGDGVIGHMDPVFKCPQRRMALENRRLEIRQEYSQMYPDLRSHLSDIVLDMMKKGEAGEFLGEDGPGAHDWGGYFYTGVLSQITGIPERELWSTLHRMKAAGLLKLEVAVIQPVGRPKYPIVSN